MLKDAEGRLGLYADDQLLDIYAAAELVGYSVATLRRWDKQGKPGFTALRTPGGQLRFVKAHMLANLYREPA